jgi:hypothetical protein
MVSSGIRVGPAGNEIIKVEHINIHTPIEKNVHIVLATILIVNNVIRTK